MLLKKEWIQHNFWWSFELSITFIRFETATKVHGHLVYLEDIAQGKNEPFGKRFDMHFEHNAVKIEKDNARYNGIEGTNIDTNSISLQKRNFNVYFNFFPIFLALFFFRYFSLSFQMPQETRTIDSNKSKMSLHCIRFRKKITIYHLC